jgi:hypothetical protein
VTEMIAAIESTMEAAHRQCQPYFLQLAALWLPGVAVGRHFRDPDMITGEKKKGILSLAVSGKNIPFCTVPRTNFRSGGAKSSDGVANRSSIFG